MDRPIGEPDRASATTVPERSLEGGGVVGVVGTTIVRRAAGTLVRDRRAGIAALLAFWVGVGVVTALQKAAALNLGGGGVELSRAVHRGLVAGLPWVPLTLGILYLGRRFPLRGSGGRRALALHLPASLAAPFLYNLAFWLLWRPEHSLSVTGSAALRTGLENIHLVAATYWVILAAGMWRARLLEPAGGPSPPSDVLTVRSGQAVEVVRVEGVAWIEGAGDYARLHTDDGSYLSSATLKELADRLSDRGFLRIHRSSIVNLDRVRSYRPLGHGDYEVALNDGTTLKVSRSHGRAFRRRMGR